MIDSQMDDMTKEKLALKEKKHVAMPVIDNEETLLLEEESRSKMSEKAKDPETVKLNISHKPIDYEKLNRLTEDFEKRFTPQQELSAEQAFWLRISNPTIEYSLPLVRVEVPIELPKKRTTPNALTEGKTTADNDAQIPSATTVVPGMFKLDLEPLAPKLIHNRKCHIFYLKHTQDQADILQGLVEQAKAKQPFNNELDFAYKYAKRIQELLVYVRDTCPSAIRLRETKVAIIPMNKIKKVTFTEPIVTSSTN
nr:hypothetical protein [Tanacetum cinerariifolium]